MDKTKLDGDSLPHVSIPLSTAVVDVDTLDFYEYQAKTSETAIYPEPGTIVGLMYCALGAASETGEIAGKIKKYFRDGVIDFDDMEKEIGDVLWYLSQICNELGLTLQDAAAGNLNKLASRKARGVIGGNGDNR